jgi:hypothetical protein
MADESGLSMSCNPRVVFLIPIPSSRRAQNWNVGCAYFKQTLSSIYNSKNDNYCVVVAGHEAPDFKLPENPRFKFLSLDHPLPSLEGGYHLAAVKDKLVKIEAAWKYAKSRWNPEYVMKFDWDDLVSSHLVEWLASAEDEAGYSIKHGWVWRSSAPQFIQRTEQFDRVCGSCLIIRSDLADKTGPFLHSCDGTKFDNMGQQTEAADEHSLVSGAGTSTLLLNDRHERADAQFAYLGHWLAIVPFSAAVWRISHGNNASNQLHRTETLRMFLGRIRRTRLVIPSLKKEFMLGCTVADWP